MAGTKRQLILASASPQRRQLLKKLGFPFRIIPSGVGEKTAETNPRRMVILLAKRKALAVAKKHPQAAVLGADTIVYCLGQFCLKPKNLTDSRRMLRLLNGRWHKVYTGVALALEGGRQILAGAAMSRVKARRLDDGELERLCGKHRDKAGSYAVQDKDDPFIENIVGDLDNVMGLPLRLVRPLLKWAR